MYTIGGIMYHSAKGFEWDHHKYVDKVRGKNGKWRYIYDQKKDPIAPTTQELHQLRDEGIEIAEENETKTKKEPSISDEQLEDTAQVLTDIVKARGLSSYAEKKLLNLIKEKFAKRKKKNEGPKMAGESFRS